MFLNRQSRSIAVSFRLLLQMPFKQPQRRNAGHSILKNTMRGKIKLFNLDSSSLQWQRCLLNLLLPTAFESITFCKSYLSVLELHGQNQLVAMIGECFSVVSLGEECRAQIPMGATFSCLVTCKARKGQKWKSKHCMGWTTMLLHFLRGNCPL